MIDHRPISACLLSLALLGCGFPKVTTYRAVESLDNPGRTGLRAVVLPFRDERPSSPNQRDIGNDQMLIMLVPLYPYSSATAEMPEKIFGNMRWGLDEWTNRLTDDSGSPAGYPEAFAYHLARDLDEYGPFSSALYAADASSVPAACAADVIISGTLRRSRYRLVSTMWGLAEAAVCVVFFVPVPVEKHSALVELELTAAPAASPDKPVWRKTYSREESKWMCIYSSGLDRKAYPFYIALPKLFAQAREDIAREMRPAGAIAAALGKAPGAGDGGLSCRQPKEMYRALREWPLAEAAESSLGFSTGKGASPAGPGESYSIDFPGEQRSAILKSRGKELKRLRIGVGPFLHLAEVPLRSTRSEVLVQAVGSGYDFSEQVAAGIQGTGLFGKVEMSNDPMEADIFVSGDFSGGPRSPEVESWGWDFTVERRGRSLLRGSVEPRAAAPPRGGGIFVFGKTPSGPAQAKGYMTAAGSLIAWKAAQALSEGGVK
jgi:hypothetical protein